MKRLIIAACVFSVIGGSLVVKVAAQALRPYTGVPQPAVGSTLGQPAASTVYVQPAVNGPSFQPAFNAFQ